MMLLIEEPEPPTFMKQLDPNCRPSRSRSATRGNMSAWSASTGDKGGYRVQYQKVLMSQDWMTPEAKKEKDNAVIALDGEV